jgi:hypothetical protein
MDKYIIRSLKIVSGEWIVDEQSFKHALNELKQRLKQLTPLFNECILKGISIEKLSPELNNEWNKIILTINKRK